MHAKLLKKVIIVGAGIAGLAACRYLAEHGVDAQILEARDYCGGRIRISHDLGIPVGQGALFIHGIENNPVAALAETFHAELQVTDWLKSVTYDRHGKLIPPEITQEFRVFFNAVLEQAKQMAVASKQDMSLASAISEFINPDNLSELEQDLLEGRNKFFEGYVGASSHALSARHWDQDEGWPGDNVFVIDSYENIIKGLAEACSVKLNMPVNKINLLDNQVEVVTATANYFADAVIVTVPLGVLKHGDIEFNPPLPFAKQKAINHLNMGLLDILNLRFSRAFWPRESHSMNFSGFNDLSFSSFFNLHHFIEEPVLIGFSGGDKAAHLENFTDAEIIEKTMSDLKKVFGNSIPHPESYCLSRWGKDTYSYGSYSYTPINSSGIDYEELADPINNLIFFAGEATDPRHPATTHGAYLSGIREAERIIGILG